MQEPKDIMEPKNTVLLQKKDQIAYVTLNYPERLNVVRYAEYQRLVDAVEDCRKDNNIRVMILTGAGDKVWNAGDDLREWPGGGKEEGNPHMSLPLVDYFGAFDPLMTMANIFREWDKISIMALNGVCALPELIYSADFVVAAEHASIAQMESRLACIPGAGGTQMLPRLVGRRKALEMLLLGEYITAQEAYRVGLVNQVVPLSQLMPTAEAIAQKILKISPLSVKFIKKAVQRAQDLPYQWGQEIEWLYFTLLLGTKDCKEAIKSYVEHKPMPPFKKG